MASITEISVEHIHNAYESIRGNIAVEAFYAVVTGFMAVTLIHRLYTVYREVQSNEDGTPTMKDYMNLVWQYVFCIAAVALFPVLLEALETVFGKLMDDLQAGFGGKVYDVADLFQKPDNRTVRETVQRHVGNGRCRRVAQSGRQFVRLSAGVCGRRHSRPFLHVRADPVHSRQIPCSCSCWNLYPLWR